MPSCLVGVGQAARSFPSVDLLAAESRLGGRHTGRTDKKRSFHDAVGAAAKEAGAMDGKKVVAATRDSTEGLSAQQHAARRRTRQTQGRRETLDQVLYLLELLHIALEKDHRQDESLPQKSKDQCAAAAMAGAADGMAAVAVAVAATQHCL